MPNMSRRSLHKDCESSKYSSQYTETTEKDDVYKYHTNTRLEPRQLFVNRNEYTLTRRVTRTFSSMCMKTYTLFFYILSSIYESSTTALLWFARGYYRFVGRILLFDTWLLQNSPSHRKMMRALFAILLLPLFLWAGRYKFLIA